MLNTIFVIEIILGMIIYVNHINLLKKIKENKEHRNQTILGSIAIGVFLLLIFYILINL